MKYLRNNGMGNLVYVLPATFGSKRFAVNAGEVLKVNDDLLAIVEPLMEQELSLGVLEISRGVMTSVPFEERIDFTNSRVMARRHKERKLVDTSRKVDNPNEDDESSNQEMADTLGEDIVIRAKKKKRQILSLKGKKGTEASDAKAGSAKAGSDAISEKDESPSDTE